MQTLRNLFKNETVIAVLLILLTTVITYGISIPKLGYYHDDWYMLWSGQARGAASIITLFSIDRPFMGVVYSYVYRLLGDNILNWHMYALLWRFIGGMAFFWILRLLWPKQKYITTLMVVLFIVYPGFLSLPNANTKQNHLYGFGTALLSIALMIQAMKTNSRIRQVVYSILSIILAANYLFIYEYMIGFEGTRFLLIGYVLFQGGIRRFRSLAMETIKRFLPYAAVTGGFLYWRIFIFESSRNATDASRLAGDYLGNLRYMSTRLALETAKDFLDTSIFAWFVKPYHLFSETTYSSLGSAVLIAVIVMALAFLYTYLFKKWWGTEYNEAENSQLIKQFLGIGTLIIIFAVAPVVLSGRQVDLNDAYKSYGLHPIGGVVLFITGNLLMLQPHFRKVALLALIRVSVSAQVVNAGDWIQLWDQQRETWWQLTWRAPDIKDGTMVVAYLPEGYRVQQDYEVWGPVNIIYRPAPAESPGIQAEVLTPDTAYDILKRAVIDNQMRDIEMHKDFNNLLLISLPSLSSCIHVIDGALPVYSEIETLQVQQVGGYSHIDRIVPSGQSPVPPSSIFGTEPEHTWCYYYQKATLARQIGDWEEIDHLYDQAVSLGLKASDKAELFPFFEALVNLGRYDDAQRFFNGTFRGNKQIRLPLCASLSTNPGYPPEFRYNYEAIYDIFCN